MLEEGIDLLIGPKGTLIVGRVRHREGDGVLAAEKRESSSSMNTLKLQGMSTVYHGSQTHK